MGRLPGGRVRDLLIVTEIACTVLLLVTAGLLIKSFWHLRATDPGFRPAGVLSLHLAVNRTKQGDDPGVARYLGRLIERVRAVPGVDAVGIVNRLPLGGRVQGGPIKVDGHDAPVQTTRALGSMLHGVGAWDPLTYTTVSGLLIVVVLAASFVPAWAASRLESEDRNSAGLNPDSAALKPGARHLRAHMTTRAFNPTNGVGRLSVCCR